MPPKPNQKKQKIKCHKILFLLPGFTFLRQLELSETKPAIKYVCSSKFKGLLEQYKINLTRGKFTKKKKYLSIDLIETVSYKARQDQLMHKKNYIFGGWRDGSVV